MAKKNYYAVRKGRTPGIYTSWEECEKQIKGYSNTEYKGFTTYDAAAAYLLAYDCLNTFTNAFLEIQKDNEAIAYVDGSYDNNTGNYSCGVVIFWKGQKYEYSKQFRRNKKSKLRNVAGELEGAMQAISFCCIHEIPKLFLYYDYEGIEKWCAGKWKTNKQETQTYRNYYLSCRDKVQVVFQKVTAHSGNKYNELADRLAKEALQSN